MSRTALVVLLALSSAFSSSAQIPSVETAPVSISQIEGTYDTGVNLSVATLTIKPDSTFHYRSEGDLGVYAEATGSVEIEGRVVKLTDVTPTGSSSGFSQVPQQFHVVLWGQRTYLLEPSQKIGFCNSVNLGEEPRRYEWGVGFFLLRAGEFELPASGWPEVPSEWASCILHVPLYGEVLRRTPETATISIGSNHGVFVGMELESENIDLDLFCILEVLSVQENTSTTTIDEDCELLPVGNPVTSRFE